MQKTIINKLGAKIGIYFPITQKLVLTSGKQLKFDRVTFNSYCEDMQWSMM